MDATNKDLSLMFYQYLCDVIGSEEVVRTRRGILASYGKHFMHDKIFFTSGSKAEGLDFKDSDFDIMIILPLLPVFENHDDVTYTPDKQQLIIDSTDTKPGFTRIRPSLKFLDSPSPFVKNVNRKICISSKLFREYYNYGNISGIIHGPCTSMPDGSLDVAFTLHCRKWISLVKPWIVRSQYSWATDEVLEQIIDFGVLFVPIGYKKSPYEDIEWRISFSHAEKLLICSLNHVQFLCYALMKIVLKDLIKNRHGDLLCSYFMKTIMFWMCEETEVIQWRPDNILLCFTNCLKRLVYCVQHKTCLHFFIPENNFFEERFDVDQHKSLLETINQLSALGWICLLNTETLRNFHNLLDRSIMDVLSVSFITICTGTFNSNSFLSSHESRYNHLETEPLIIYNIYHLLCRKELKDFLIYTLSTLCQVFAGEVLSNVFKGNNSNKKKYKFYRKGLCYSLLGTNHDAMSGWVLLAIFFYMNKENLKCEHLLEYIFSKHSDDKFLVTRNMDARDEHIFNMIQRTYHMRMIHMCKIFTVTPVKLRGQSYLLPEELKLYLNSKERIPLQTFEFAQFLALRMRDLNIGSGY